MMTQADIDNAPPRLLLAYVRGLLGLVHAGRFQDTIDAFAVAGLPIDKKLAAMAPIFRRADDLFIDREIRKGAVTEDTEQTKQIAAQAADWYDELAWMQKIGERARAEGARHFRAILTNARDDNGRPQNILSGLRILLDFLPTLDAEAFGVTPDVLARGRALMHGLLKEPMERDNAVHDRVHDSQELDELLTQLRDDLGEIRDRHELAKRRRQGRPIPGFDVGILASMRPDGEPAEAIEPTAEPVRTFLPGGLDGEEAE